MASPVKNVRFSGDPDSSPLEYDRDEFYSEAVYTDEDTGLAVFSERNGWTFYWEKGEVVEDGIFTNVGKNTFNQFDKKLEQLRENGRNYPYTHVTWQSGGGTDRLFKKAEEASGERRSFEENIEEIEEFYEEFVQS